MSTQGAYLMAGRASELERLRLQARVWEPAAERLFAGLGISKGATALDLGCGAMGVLGVLSRCVGPRGKVVGIDTDALQLEAAQAYVEEAKLQNVEIIKADAFATGLPAGSFDVVHQRFVIAPVGRDAEMLNEMMRLARPGGHLVLQEPDSSSWSLFPETASFDNLKAAILRAFRMAGGDFDAGRKLLRLLKMHGARDTASRAEICTLEHGNPYLLLPVQFSKSLEPRLLNGGVKADSLEQWRHDVESTTKDPDCFGLTFTLVQAWGRKPA